MLTVHLKNKLFFNQMIFFVYLFLSYVFNHLPNIRRFRGLIVGLGDVETDGGVASVDETDGELVILISAVSKCSGNWTNL